ncbi:hypothetical protein SASPL_123588 [Salvia splendens]|uniref:Uncharacterized protein n=1 Tax=Salvia splendens TaxID=180675 RepID=A0A8X8XNG6_SALSN|nr:hypothetical protein SASPL_123588 [Salvia splendens]
MRPSPVLRSPFEIRVVHMKPTLNPDERDIYYYIVETEGTNEDLTNVNNINLDRCCQILFSNIFSHVIQVFFPVFTSRYYYLVVFWMKINKIEIIDSVKPPKDKDPLEKYNLDVGILKDMFEAYFKEKNISELSENIKKSPYKVVPLDWATSTNKEDSGIYLMRHWKKGKGMEYWLFSTWHKDSTDTQRKILRSDAYIRDQQEVMDIVHVADDWMTANKHRLPELQNKFKEWFSCRSKK